MLRRILLLLALPLSVSGQLKITNSSFTNGFGTGAGGAITVISSLGLPSPVKVDRPDMEVKLNGTVSVPNTHPALFTVDFGSARIGGNVSLRFYVNNKGTANLTLGTLNLSGTNQADFSINQATMASSVSPGGSTFFEVRFAPTATGFRSAKLSISNSDVFNDPYEFLLIGTGTAPTPALPASNISFSQILSTQMQLAFSAGDGTNHLVVLNSGPVSFVPADGVTYPPGDAGGGNRIISIDARTSLSLTGLTPSTLYYVKVYEFNVALGQPYYLTAGAPSSSQQTAEAPVAFVISPANNALHVPIPRQRLDVTSSEVPGASQYTIELNTRSNFTGTSLVRTGWRTLTFSELQKGTKYYNRVKTNLSPNWGPTGNFITVGPPEKDDAKEKERNEEGISVKAYPNPFGDRFEVFVSTDDQQSISVVLTDLNGKVVFRSNGWMTNEAETVSGQYNPGIYLLEVQIGTLRKVVRVIKQ
jgi:hypothetical protein